MSSHGHGECDAGQGDHQSNQRWQGGQPIEGEETKETGQEITQERLLRSLLISPTSATQTAQKTTSAIQNAASEIAVSQSPTSQTTAEIKASGKATNRQIQKTTAQRKESLDEMKGLLKSTASHLPSAGRQLFGITCKPNPASIRQGSTLQDALFAQKLRESISTATL